MFGSTAGGDREDDAGQRNDGPFQTHPGIGAQEIFAHVAGGFPGESGHGDRGDSRVHI